MPLDAFVFESDSPREAALASARLCNIEEIDTLVGEIRKQGNSRDFPIILKTILAQGKGKKKETTTEIAHNTIPNLVEELDALKAGTKTVRVFKNELLELCKVAFEAQRPILF